jgi:hypothetical protein
LFDNAFSSIPLPIGTLDSFTSNLCQRWQNPIYVDTVDEIKPVSFPKNGKQPKLPSKRWVLISNPVQQVAVNNNIG